MKKLCACLLALMFCLPALAEQSFVYSTASVATCEQKSSIYNTFYQSGELSISIPGVAEGLVPQGIAYLAEENCFLFAGYRADKGSSALIAVDCSTNQVVKEVYLQNIDGSIYNGHAGGVCVTEKNIFLSNAHKLLRISLSSFRALPATGSCAFEEVIPVPVNSSYCCYDEGILWVGEFEYSTSYQTDRSHKLKSADGIHRAWACGYVLDQHSENEFKPDAIPAEGDAIPDYILSTTERIQGITVNQGKIYLSQSYGRTASSIIYRYRNVLLEEPVSEGEVSGQTVPIWMLDSKTMDSALICPPMSECLCTVDGAVYILFESAAQPYIDLNNPAHNPMDRVYKLTDF